MKQAKAQGRRSTLSTRGCEAREVRGQTRQGARELRSHVEHEAHETQEHIKHKST